MEIKAIAMPGTHQSFLRYFITFEFPRGTRVLDIGAGHGAFSKKLYEMDFAVSACDLFPEMFRFDGISCLKADITSHLPYDDKVFDCAIAIEVSEHIPDHETFFHEAARVLKARGHLFLSTPNILSLKSRMRFLFKGFTYSFKLLDIDNYDGLQHVSSMSLDQYIYIAKKHGLRLLAYETDKKQKSSQWLYYLLYPFLMMNFRMKGRPNYHNKKKLLLGRLLFLHFQNENESSVE